MSDEPYYAEDGRVWKHPVTKMNADGSKSISIGFPVLTVADGLGDDAAETIAALMNAGERALNKGAVMFERCKECRFFSVHLDPRPSQAGMAACYRHPPIAQTDRRAIWPFVYEDDWCGEFQPKEDGET